VLAVSASPQALASDDPADAGYNACLLKPIELADLRNTLARLLNLHRDDTRAAPDAAQATDLPGPRPSRELLHDAQQLIAMGAITDLIDWARELSARAPQFDGFARHIQQLAQRGDLAGLTALCDAPSAASA
jgi:hypothetical protein